MLKNQEVKNDKKSKGKKKKDTNADVLKDNVDYEIEKVDIFCYYSKYICSFKYFFIFKYQCFAYI